MWIGNVLAESVCPYICLSVCLYAWLSMCLSVSLNIETSFLDESYILTISKSSLSVKVIGSRSRSCAKNDNLLILTCYFFVCGFRSLMRSRSHQGLGQINVKVKSM